MFDTMESSGSRMGDCSKMNNNNDKIKSVYDHKLMADKRKKSALAIIEKLAQDKDFILVDKSKVFFGVKASRDNGYYAIQQDPKDENRLMCNCFDFAHYIEVDPKHECKHVIAVKETIKQKMILKVKDLSGLLVDDNTN